MNHVRLRPAPLLNQWEPHGFQAGGEREAQTPFPAHWLWTPGRGQDTQPQTVHMHPEERPRPVLWNAGSDPATCWTSCPGPTSRRPCVPTRGTWLSGCSPLGSSCHHLRTKTSRPAPPLQFLGLTTSVHMPRAQGRGCLYCPQQGGQGCKGRGRGGTLNCRQRCWYPGEKNRVPEPPQLESVMTPGTSDADRREDLALQRRAHGSPFLSRVVSTPFLVSGRHPRCRRGEARRPTI